MTKASDYYSANAATCSALLGRYLFEEARPDAGDLAGTQPLRLCLGEGDWLECAGGLSGVIAEVRREVELNDQAGLRSSDLAEDWGVIANEAGQILYRASHTGGVCKLRYLGVEGGPMEAAPITVQRVGIAWAPRETATDRIQRQRG